MVFGSGKSARERNKTVNTYLGQELFCWRMPVDFGWMTIRSKSPRGLTELMRVEVLDSVGSSESCWIGPERPESQKQGCVSWEASLSCLLSVG